MAERTKVCTRCQTDRPWSDYYPRERWPDGTMLAPRPRCKRCDAEDVALRRKQNATGYGDRCRAGFREWHKRQRRNPETAALVRDQDRTRHARRVGESYVPRPRRRKAGTQPRTFLPAGPLAAWLATLGDTPAVIARASGLNERRIHGVMKGEQERVELDTVDRALLAVGDGTTLEDLYDSRDLAA